MRWFWKVCRFLLIILIGLEVFLQFYNPFTSRIKIEKIILPKNTSYEINQNETNVIDTHILHTKNSLGFRGEEPNKDKKKIIFMGGSTTECFYLSDGKDWPNLLAKKLEQKDTHFWVNNAGMDGHSTFGHLKMLKNYVIPLKPKYIILMCGLNDLHIKEANQFEEKKLSWTQSIYQSLEIPSTIINLLRARQAQKAGLNHQIIPNISLTEKLEISDSVINELANEEKEKLKQYKKRLNKFAQMCKKNNITLILVSQSILFSNEYDLVSDVYLGNIKTGNLNGKTMEKMIKLYNQATEEIANKNRLKFVPLAKRLPKDSRFFYDGYHFSNEGSEMVSEIIYDELKFNLK
ncbi:MAG: GDSL-type esterase/lipase family protein [Bacteroidota bacterium]|nr:GDSL-type esterase/lipase family protein [Bacteroidota bacterium]